MKKDIRFVATSVAVVQGMLELARVGADDCLFDLGSGDGRLVIAAAQLGARAVGIEIDPSLVQRSRENAERAGVRGVEFRRGNFFDADLTGATVVTLYLLHKVNLALLPRLLAVLPLSTRIVSHSFEMGDWEPQRTITVEQKLIHLWVL